MTKQSEFVLQHEDGSFHAYGLSGMGKTIVRAFTIESAYRFSSMEYAVNARSNEPHLRDIPLRILELKYEVIDHGIAPQKESQY